MMKQWVPALISTYGLLIWIEGMIGYALTQYFMLLILGSVAGSVLVVSGFTMMRENLAGYWGAVTVTTFLTLLFAYGLFHTHNLMPFGMMTALSLIFVVLLIFYK